MRETTANITLTVDDGCRPVDVAAYLDGELDDARVLLFEAHLKTCRSCLAALAEQRRLLCVLDTALGERVGNFGAAPALPLPRDFTRIVKARAQSDMGQVRASGERRRAVVCCAVLLVLSGMAFGGRRAFGDALAPARGVARVVWTVLEMFGHALAATGACVWLVLRAVSFHLLSSEPGALQLAVLLLFACTLALLLRLLNSYHRLRLPD